MTENIFKNIADKKKQFKRYAKSAHEFKWINNEEYNNILKKLDADVLTIGVIGQMKCGKSTLLNALIFGKEVLPAATTPMTASLTIITYGKQKQLEAEFYTSNEWSELKHFASRDLNEVDDDFKFKIQAAKEIVEKSVKIESEINSLLGSKKEDNFDKLIDYVGADGKYIAITKSVKIYMPLNYLKGVEIVDTPGLNDPIVSREERTKDFLSRADAVIMLLYAGRAFDSTDKDIIFNKLRGIGIGKLLIGVNKYDLCIENDSESDIISNVKNELLRASKEYQNNSIAKLAIEKDPLLLSANMALMSKMDIDKISKDKNWNFYYKKASDIFGTNNQKEMLKKSLFPEFEKTLLEIISKSKYEILLKKPKNFINQKAENKKEKLEENLMQIQSNLTILNKPDEELEELLSNTKRADRKINRKLNNIEINIEDTLESNTKKLTRKTRDIIYDSKIKCKEIIDSHGVVLKSDNLNEKLKAEIEELDIQLTRLFERSNDGINADLKRIIDNFISDIDEISEDYLNDFDMHDYIASSKKLLFGNIIEISLENLIPSLEEESEEGLLAIAISLVGSFIDGYTLGLLGVANNVVLGKNQAREWIDNIYSILDLEPIRQEIKNNGLKIINGTKEKFKEDFLEPIIQKTNEIIDNKDEREKDLSETKNKLAVIKDEKEKLESEIQSMQLL
jgi:predicted GTPase